MYMACHPSGLVSQRARFPTPLYNATSCRWNFNAVKGSTIKTFALAPSQVKVKRSSIEELTHVSGTVHQGTTPSCVSCFDFANLGYVKLD